MGEYNKATLTSEQNNVLAPLRAKLMSLAQDIKSILEQGRSISNDASNLFMFKGMYIELRPYYNTFNLTWDQIITLFHQWELPANFPSKEDGKLQGAVKKYYYECCAIYQQHMNPTPLSRSETNVTASNASLNESRTVRARLPQINLPTYNGDQATWPLFRDTYLSLIHDEVSLPKIEKFLFLISCLKGPALALVKSINLTEDNYDQAWKLLTDTYNDKRRLASNYLNKVLEFVPFKTRPSVYSLKSLLTVVGESIDSFRQLKIPQADDFILSCLVLRCLDPETRRSFERQNSKTEFPTYKDLKDFIRVEWRSLDLTTEQSESRVPTESNHRKFTPSNNRFRTSLLTEEPQNHLTQYSNNFRSKGPSCPVCKAYHSLYQCSEFKKLTAENKLKSLQHWNGCKNCLSSTHHTGKCSSLRKCQKCNKRHHSWLHVDLTGNNQDHRSAQASHDSEGIALGGLCSKGDVMLGTAIVEIQDVTGHYQRVRTVTDGGSQFSFMTENCMKRLGLSMASATSNISGVGQSPLPGMVGKLSCKIRSALQSHLTRPVLSTDAVVIKRITGNLPHATLPSHIIERYHSYVLADEEFWKPGPIEFLLGGDLYYDIIIGRPISVDHSLPWLLPTLFGHVVAGRSLSCSPSAEATALLVHTEEDISKQIQKFWEIEEVPKRLIQSEEEKYCESHFVQTHYRLPSGRYVVSLPIKEGINSLIHSNKQALSRFINLERKFVKDESLRQEYNEFMSDYIKLGHMRLTSADATSYTIPHHPVFKTSNGERKIRVVFDASCSTGHGSLNDYLLTGPKLQSDISDILSNFRLNKIAFITDMVKMFRQIIVNPADRKYQHVLWRADQTEELKTWELCTVTQGEKPSSWLAQGSIRQLVFDEGKPYPMASKVLLEDVYMDDIPTGANSLEDALQLQNELVALLAKGGFELSKWASNSPSLMDHLSNLGVDDTIINFSDEEDSRIKLLGIQWIPKEDIFTYDICIPTFQPTKRAILSAIARMYDPLGYLSPVIFLAKTILQELWIAKCGWDDIEPSDTCNKWHTFLKQLHMLSEIKIPRCITSLENETYMIVGFSDASQKGYSAVLYLHVTTRNNCRSHLLRAKTKLASIKPLSIPRLELCGALLLARLYESIKNFRNRLNIQSARFFTDAQVVLAWLAYPPQQLKTFVAHRVVEILELTHGHQWSFTSSQDNPADCSSRGLMPSELQNHTLWWAGPPWLLRPESDWIVSVPNPKISLPELKSQNVTALAACTGFSMLEWMQGFSSLTKLLHTVAYIQRFIRKMKKEETPKGPILVSEIRASIKQCIKLSQEGSGLLEKTNQEFKNLRTLCPFFDEDGLLRVGGRLQQSSLRYDAKHPYIVPGKTHFARLLVDHYHKLHLHLGPTALHALLSNKYWITSARSLIKQRIFKCSVCYKATHSPQAPLMGNLPVQRLQEGQVFTHVGVDLGGPFYIRESMRRKASLSKAYLCLSLCMSTKAVHIEIVSKCSTDAFLAAFDRFVSRRGRPTHIYSDCGTNFVGAANRLREWSFLMKDKETQNCIIEHAAIREIQWSFNPPSAPHFGGLWEAGIKSCKSILYKVIGDLALTFEELTTIFCSIEAILNSRPLVSINSDVTAEEYLSPGHFLIGRPLIAPPEDIVPDQVSTLQRWKVIRQKTQHFWQRWRMEYLHQLQQRRKWYKNIDNVRVGDLVIVKEPHSPQRSWPMARVIQVHPGKDNIVRVATIRTSNGIYKRPIAKLVSLTPITD